MYYFIVNPSSDNGKGELVWRKLENRLNRTKVEYEAFLTNQPGDARRFAKELSQNCKEERVIVAVGGDGTVNEILDGLSLSAPITLGFIPAGVGNDVARSLHLPRKPLGCLRRILSPRAYQMIDYGVVSYGNSAAEHRRFLVSCGIGLDAAVCHEILERKQNKKRKRIPTRFSYAICGLRQLIRSKPARGYLVLDGIKKVEFNHISFVSAHIHPYEGGGFCFAPHADCGDGRLEVCVVHSAAKRKMMPIMIHSFLGLNRWNRGVRLYQCSNLKIHVDIPLPVHADGESCKEQQDIEVSCIQKKLRVIV